MLFDYKNLIMLYLPAASLSQRSDPSFPHSAHTNTIISTKQSKACLNECPRQSQSQSRPTGVRLLILDLNTSFPCHLGNAGVHYF